MFEARSLAGRIGLGVALFIGKSRSRKGFKPRVKAAVSAGPSALEGSGFHRRAVSGGGDLRDEGVAQLRAGVALEETMEKVRVGRGPFGTGRLGETAGEEEEGAEEAHGGKGSGQYPVISGQYSVSHG